MKNRNLNYIKTIVLITLFGIFLTNIASVGTPKILPEKAINYPKNAFHFFTIDIDGNDELESFVSEEDIGGDGTASNPYIIEKFFCNSSYGPGIEIHNTDLFVIIRNCTVEGYDISYEGIYLNNTKNIDINNNFVSNNSKGILIEKSANIDISENDVNNNYYGIYLLYCNYSSLSKNDVNYNERDGVYLYETNYSTILENNVYNNQHTGFRLKYIFNNTLSGNSAYNNDRGFSISDSSNNIIFENIVRNNSRGISLISYCNNNKIYSNDIYENQYNEAIEGEDCIDNQWDNGQTGNYWGNYTEKYPEAKKDGIVWDTPYEIDGDGLGIDNFPLVKPMSDESISISGYPLVNFMAFISVGVFLLRRKTKKN